MDFVGGGKLKSTTLASRSSTDFEVSIPLFWCLIRCACAIDAEVDGDTVDPCIKSASPVETGQSSIGFKEHILGNIKSILMCFDVSLGQLSRLRSGNG